jgi:polysaccharide biosynthesis/export protein
MFQKTSHRLLFAAMIMIAFNMISCTPSKKVIYLYDLKDSTAGDLRKAQTDFENPIQKNDQLWITVGGSNPSDLIALNSANGIGTSTSSSITNQSAFGYLVEADGKIQMPYAGRIQVEGLTRVQLEDTLTVIFKDYTKNPVVNVRFLNYNFSVLGEVNNRGRFTMPNERTTILEAISMAGDLTEFGMRNNVLVVREVNGERTFSRINLLSKDLFKSPYYYLKTNDVVYVEAVKAKFITRTGVPQYLAIAALALSLLITVIAVSN